MPLSVALTVEVPCATAMANQALEMVATVVAAEAQVTCVVRSCLAFVGECTGGGERLRQTRRHAGTRGGHGDGDQVSVEPAS